MSEVDSLMRLDVLSSRLMVKLAELGARPVNEMTPAEARAFGQSLRAKGIEGPAVARIDSAVVRHDTGSFRVNVVVPLTNVIGVIVYYHGGGWVLGDIDDAEPFARLLASRTGCAVVMVNYRLAPEHPYPAALDDCYAALTWVWERRQAIAGRETCPMIVMGDSAGGNLAAVTALRARDDAGPPIAMQVLAYPVTDCDLDRPSYRDPANQLLLTRASMEWFWDHYLPDVSRRSEAAASPLRADDLRGLPAALVLTAGHDPLRDEGEAYAARLIAAGVPVRFRRYEEQMHGFLTMVGILPVSEQAIGEIAEAIRSVLAHAPAARA